MRLVLAYLIAAAAVPADALGLMWLAGAAHTWWPRIPTMGYTTALLIIAIITAAVFVQSLLRAVSKAVGDE